MTAGFHGGDLVILAGRPGMGKTAVALIWQPMRSHGECVRCYFQTQMPTNQLVTGMLACEAG